MTATCGATRWHRLSPCAMPCAPGRSDLLTSTRRNWSNMPSASSPKVAAPANGPYSSIFTRSRAKEVQRPSPRKACSATAPRSTLLPFLWWERRYASRHVRIVNGSPGGSARPVSMRARCSRFSSPEILSGATKGRCIPTRSVNQPSDTPGRVQAARSHRQNLAAGELGNHGEMRPSGSMGSRYTFLNWPLQWTR